MAAPIVPIIKLWLLIKPIKRIKQLRKARELRKLLKEIDMQTLITSLKSKTIWFGIATEAWGLAQVFLADGTFTKEAIISLISGVVIIILRTVTSVPLAAK